MRLNFLIPLLLLLFIASAASQSQQRTTGTYHSGSQFHCIGCTYQQSYRPYTIIRETPYTWSSYWFSRAANPYYIYPSYEEFENPFTEEYIDSILQASEDRTQQIMDSIYSDW